MALTPLQLTAGSALIGNVGINGLPAALTAAINSYNATTVMQNFFAAVGYYRSQSFATSTVLDALLSVGNSVCPALGNSIPVAPVGIYPNLVNRNLIVNTVPSSTVIPVGFTWFVQQTAAAYLGSGDVGRMAQGFMAVQGYTSATNQFINSAVNAQTYLGPTFTSMDALVTNQLSVVNPDFGNFATDLAQQGQLTNLANLDQYSTPAALLKQVSSLAGLGGSMISAVRQPLLAAGLTVADINTLIVGQNSVTPSRYDLLQRRAYTGMQQVTGAELDQVLQILDVTTPNISTMADLLNQVKIFPNSYATLQVPTPVGPLLIYNNNSVNLGLAQSVSGCDDLSKVIPAEIAVSGKAVQAALQQVTGISTATLPALAQTINGYSNNVWDLNKTYQADSVVSAPMPALYRAQQDVPIGANINNTAYWLPTTTGGLNTMAGLPAIQAQTTAITPSVAGYYQSMATGTGPNNTITICDVLGTAIDYNNFSAQLTAATVAVNHLQTAGDLVDLNAAYVAVLTAGDDAAVITQINNANAAIAALIASADVTVLNTAWTYIAGLVNKEKGYQISAGVDYFNLQAGEMVSVMGFVQQLLYYGAQTAAGGPAYWLQQVANISVLGGQAIVGCLREGQNQQRLAASGLDVNYAPATVPEVTPVPVLVPVY